jgi:NAD(P)-dependent dehydrogenase (short-subunit alcohol dehydrogenase family)
MTERTERVVVVTGASRGIGAACVEHLAARGWRVFAGVRSAEDAARLRSAGADPLRIDVTCDESVAAAAATVAEAAPGGVHGLVNNAGLAVPGPLEFLPVERFRHQLEVNVTGVLRCGQAFLPLLRRGRGRMVNMSSMAGRVAGPMLGAYHASKYALEGMSDSWRRELIPHGLWVALVEPGAIATDIWDTSRGMAEDIAGELPPAAQEHYGRLFEASRGAVEEVVARAIPPAAVAEAVAHALESPKPRTRYVVGDDARGAIRAARWLPDKWMDRLVLKHKG